MEAMEKIVVIIDDDKDDLGLMADAVKEFDASFQCRLYSDAEAAIESLINKRELNPCCIFIDVNMPKIAGDELLKVFRKDEIFKHATIAMISTTMSHEHAARFLREGANYTFPKPVAMSQYNSIFEAVLPSS